MCPLLVCQLNTIDTYVKLLLILTHEMSCHVFQPKQMGKFAYKQNLTLSGLVRDTKMAAVSLFRGTNMTVVKSCEDREFIHSLKFKQKATQRNSPQLEQLFQHFCSMNFQFLPHSPALAHTKQCSPSFSHLADDRSSDIVMYSEHKQ